MKKFFFFVLFLFLTSNYTVNSATYITDNIDEFGCDNSKGYVYNMVSKICENKQNNSSYNPDENIFPTTINQESIFLGTNEDENGCKFLEKCARPWEVENIFSWAKKSGLTTTTSLVDFRGDDFVTRQEVAGFIFRAFENKIFSAIPTTLVEYHFEDKNLIAKEFSSAIQFVSNSRIITPAEKFFPTENITYRDVFVILYRSAFNSLNKNFDEIQNEIAKIGITIDKNNLDNFIDRKTFVLFMRFYSDFVFNKNKTELEGNWNLISFKENDKSPKNIEGTLKIEGNSMNAKFCNILNGEFLIENGIIKSPNFISTRMYCEGDIMIAENNSSLNNATFAFTKGNKNLIITTEKGDIYTFSK